MQNQAKERGEVRRERLPDHAGCSRVNCVAPPSFWDNAQNMTSHPMLKKKIEKTGSKFC